MTIKMETLRDLKDVIIVVYAKMIEEVPLRSNLPYELTDLTKKSLLLFKQSFIGLEKTLGGDTDMYAHWMTVQLHVMTLLNGDDTLLRHHTKTVFQTLQGTSGGQTADLFLGKDNKKMVPDDYPQSVHIALAFRVFLDNIEVIMEAAGKTPPPPAPAVKKEGGKP